uniref:tRNA (adenine(58)-N(1))-methyltransferase n=1 Tax=Parascaris equorum TaxID=6256 RepID=A0A914R4V9_PAREQ
MIFVWRMRYAYTAHIACSYGSRVSATAGYVYVLRPSADLWTRTLPRRTQILYTPDCALILLLLDAKPGSVNDCIFGHKTKIAGRRGKEAENLSDGSLSHALAMTIAPSGHLYTHDIEEPRVKQVEEELKVTFYACAHHLILIPVSSKVCL